MTAVGGLIAGAATIALLPERTLFSETAGPETAAASAPGERWACPMMDFIGTKPGDCPVCGMQMTKVTAGELALEQQRRMGVEIVRVTEGPATSTVRAYGMVRYDDRTAQVVIPRVAGRVVKRHPAALHPGTLVQAGDPVVDLYSPEAFAAQGELAAAVTLGDAHTLSALLQRFMRWNLASLAEAVVAGKGPTDTFPITAPFSGLVVLDTGEAGMTPARLPQVGQEIMADTPLLRLVEPRSFMLILQVPETRAHWVRVGQAVKLSSDDRGELPDVQAAVSWVSPESRRRSGPISTWRKLAPPRTPPPASPSFRRPRCSRRGFATWPGAWPSARATAACASNSRHSPSAHASRTRLATISMSFAPD